MVDDEDFRYRQNESVSEPFEALSEGVDRTFNFALPST